MITQSMLKYYLEYNPENGTFIWLNSVSHRVSKGDKAGCVRGNGYFYIGLLGKPYLLHRLAWLYIYGNMPKSGIDHINCNPLDNRICNLRLANQSQNMCNKGVNSNNKLGIKGVHFCNERKKYVAQLKIDGKSVYADRFNDSLSAKIAYNIASLIYHGEFGRAA